MLFFLKTNQCFSNVSAMELFVMEKKLFIHEYISGYYRVASYFFTTNEVVANCYIYLYFVLHVRLEAKGRCFLYNDVYPYAGGLHSQFHGTDHSIRSECGLCSNNSLDHILCVYDALFRSVGKFHKHCSLVVVASVLQHSLIQLYSFAL